MIIPASAESIQRAAQALAAGEVVGIPTETVYGLAANAFDARAVARIFELKNRPAVNPLIAHLSSLDRVSLVATISAGSKLDRQIERLSVLIPGPLSLILPSNGRVVSAVTAGKTSIAVRIPQHPTALQILSRCEFPVAAPSANISNYVSPTTARHVLDGFGEALSLIIDGGPCQVGIESTILSLIDDAPRVLRSGSIPAEVLADILHVPLADLLDTSGHSPESPTAPGMMREHYSPRTPLYLLETLTELPHGKRAGVVSFNESNPLSPGFDYVSITYLSSQGELAEVSRNLFAALRQLDEAGLDLIVVDTCSEAGIGRAIMDRLRRASARSNNQ